MVEEGRKGKGKVGKRESQERDPESAWGKSDGLFGSTWAEGNLGKDCMISPSQRQ